MRHLNSRMLVLLAALVLPWAVSAQSASQAGQPPTQAATTPPPALSPEFAPKPYTVGPDDRVSLRFFNVTPEDMDMSNAYLVQSDGTIQLKYGNPLRIAGMTVLEIQEAVLKLLVPNFYQNGVITLQVEVTEQREQSVFVQGHVMAPGEKRLRGNQMSVNRAIFTAGGFSTTAGQEVDIQRDGKIVATVTRTQLENGEDPALVEGDTVAVRQGTFYFINGEIVTPGKKPWEVGLTVGRAVANAGGMTTKGKYGHINRPYKEADGTIKYKKIKDLKPETLVLPDDEIHIARKWFGG